MRSEPRISVAALAAVALLASACVSHSSSPRANARARPALDGRLLIGEGENFNQVSRYALPSGLGTPVRRAQFGENRFLEGAAVGPDGRAYVMVHVMVQRSGFVGASLRTVRSQLYELSPKGTARRIGRPFENGYLLGVDRNTAVASSCGARDVGGVFTLDLRRGGRWHRAAPGSCSAALAPDSRHVAFERDRGREVWESPIGSGERPTRVVKLLDLPQLRSLGINDPRIGSLAWGRPGLAMLVTNGRAFPQQPNALVITGPHVRTTVLGLGSATGNALTWQPAGDLLAFTNYSQSGSRFFGFRPEGADLRLYDAAAGRLRQLAASPGDFQGLEWSPDGGTLVTGWNQAKLMFVDVRTGAVETKAIQALPLAWEAR